MKKRGEITNEGIFHKASREFVQELDRLYTFPNPAFQQALRFSPYGVPKRIPEYLKKAVIWEDAVSVPRGFSPNLLTEASREEYSSYGWEDNRQEVPVSFPKLLFKLNKEQQVMLDAFKRVEDRETRPFGGRLFVAPTSLGKSFMAIAVAKETKQKTLILCLTNLIRDSWYSEILKMTGIPKSEVGLIQQSTEEIGDVFTLASISTIIRRQHYWDLINREFGTIIFDEVHGVSGKHIEAFISQSPAKYLIGATATPFKDNDTFSGILSHFGSPIKWLLPTQRNTESSLALSDVEVIRTNFEYHSERKDLDWHHLTSSISTDDDRNRIICEEVKKDWDNGDSVLVVSKRVAHVKLLAEILQDMGVEDANVLTGSTNINKIYTNALIQGVLSRKIRCVVATTQAVRLGVNLNPLNRLHIAMPSSSKVDLEQLIGRIRRRAKNKKECSAIYYLDDNVGYLNHIFKKKAVPVFKKMNAKSFKDVFIA